jgi:hypothetical protein
MCFYCCRTVARRQLVNIMCFYCCRSLLLGDGWYVSIVVELLLGDSW